MDLAAYYALQHSALDARLKLSAPFTMDDSVSALLLSRGKRPEGPQAVVTPSAPKPTPVTVHGGAATDGVVRSAEAWADANRAAHWAASTGSSPAAIQWALSDE